MKSLAVAALCLLATASAFNSPLMATRAVGRPSPVKKAIKTVEKTTKSAPVRKAVRTVEKATKALPKNPFQKAANSAQKATKALPKNPVQKAVRTVEKATKGPSKNPFQKAVRTAQKAAPPKNPLQKAVRTVEKATKGPSKNPFQKAVRTAQKAAPIKKTVGAAQKTAPIRKAVSAAQKATRVTPVKQVTSVASRFTKTPAKKVVSAARGAIATAKRAAPSLARTVGATDSAYPSFAVAASKFKIKGISGGKRKTPQSKGYPDFSNSKLQTKRDQAFYAAAALARKTKANIQYAFDDGLSEIERRQRKTIPSFLSGSARSQIDAASIRKDILGDDLLFGLDPDRFQLLFISVFGLFTLVGTLSGNVKL